MKVSALKSSAFKILHLVLKKKHVTLLLENYIVNNLFDSLN